MYQLGVEKRPVEVLKYLTMGKFDENDGSEAKQKSGGNNSVTDIGNIYQ